MRRRVRDRSGAALAMFVVALTVGYTPPARAYEMYAVYLPCRATAVNSDGNVAPCISCHDNPDGGFGCPEMGSRCLNPFGMEFSLTKVWSLALARMDSDGDGYTNGEELGDVDGNGEPDYACNCVSRPGFATYTPADADGDGDGYCCRGIDRDDDGNCRGVGEDAVAPPDADPTFDCNEGDATINSGLAMDRCTNTSDDDCDGQPTISDPDCADVVDRDGDGYCPRGRDNNHDGYCFDPGENTGDMDCRDDAATVNPGAHEYCRDGGLDNDCNMLADDLDPACARPGPGDTDADGDGFCPIGVDTDDDGFCRTGAAETMSAEFDCDDTNVDVNTRGVESCTDRVDNDCDGFVDFSDSTCAAFFDHDEDGYCPTGRDVNRNGHCSDEGEAELPGDCDDTDSEINPGHRENCLNGDVDDDCDLASTPDDPRYDASLDDPDCVGFIDVDDDSFCAEGGDMDNDGTCIDPGEQSGAGDCDETRTDVNPAATELCTDGVDNNCDGQTDSSDRYTCGGYRDEDQDGYCLVGSDANMDQDCADPGEQGGPTEWDGDRDPHTTTGTEGFPTRYPGAPEHCFNMIDEDLDDLVDEASYCTRDADADGDGWCPIGRDVDGDGNCNGAGENIRATDCNDGRADVSPGEDERCRELLDADCDGEVGADDPDCFYLLDEDGDGICGVGVDDNGDGDCLDLDEDRYGNDCDETNPAINSDAREICDDGVDNDCNEAIDQDDSRCLCETDADCNDGDACTLDVCGERGVCARTPTSMCGDAGPGEGPPPEGCSCRAGTAPATPSWLLALAVLGLVLARRRRARSRVR